jgi:hypothetical protein
VETVRATLQYARDTLGLVREEMVRLSDDRDAVCLLAFPRAG